MSRRTWHAGSLVLLCAGLASCAAVPRERAVASVDAFTAARGLPNADWPAAGTTDDQVAARTRELLSEPLTLERALQVAFLRNIEIRRAYAELGIAEAEVIEASRLANPTFGYVDLKPDAEGVRHQITRSLSLELTDLLLLPARRRISRAEFENAQQRIGNSLFELASEVQGAWFEYVTARQVAAMRTAAADAADASADFAQRSRDAGNLTPRNYALELAAQSEARVAAARSAAAAVEKRTQLALKLGIAARERWEAPDKLPAPVATAVDESALLEQARADRLDLAVARREVAILEDGLTLARRWRFIGDVKVGYERESESDGLRLSGPSLSLQLPIFNQGQASVLRAEAQLESARARLTTLERSVRNEIALGLDRLAAAHEIAERYRTALVPQREAVVSRTLEEYNFMLTGVFELLQARREELSAYQEYLLAVRDYWLARIELRRTVGGRLPGDEAASALTIGADDVLPAQAPEHAHHDTHQPPKPNSQGPRPDGEPR